MPTKKKVFTGTGQDGYVTLYKDRHGTPLVQKPGGKLMVAPVKLITNVFDDFDELNIRFVIQKNNSVKEKMEICSFGSKLKDLKSYNSDKKHYLVIEDVVLKITKEQVFTEDSIIYVN